MGRESKAVIIGGGPAGLFAATQLVKKGITVDLYEKKSRPGLKFLLAGRSGLNITNDETPAVMAGRYGRQEELFRSLLEDFPPTALRDWLENLGIETFRGNGGKIFPGDKTAPEILTRWLDMLDHSGYFTLHTGYSWIGWEGEALLLKDNDTSLLIEKRPILIALGGASWPSTGSDGRWTSFLKEKGVVLNPFKPMNCGFLVNWSPYILRDFCDVPVKNIAITMNGESRRGDLLITEKGLEGGPLYWFSLNLREMIEKKGKGEVFMDLAPDLSLETVKDILAKRPRKKSLSAFLKGQGRFSDAKLSLLWEFCSPGDRSDPALLAQRIKALPLLLNGTDKLEKAISTSGGIDMSSLDSSLMMRNLPGIFAAGEMLDWEAPTGGYLLQGCFSTAFRAAEGMAELCR